MEVIQSKPITKVNFSEEDFFTNAKEERRKKYSSFLPDLAVAKKKWSKDLTSLKKDGFVILKNWISQTEIGKIKNFLDDCVEKGENLIPPADLSNFDSTKHFSNAKRIDVQILKKGPSFYRNKVNTVDIKDPLIVYPDMLNVALKDEIVDFVGAYLDCLPGLVYVKFRRSFVNQLPLFDTNFFHFDGGTLKPIRIFIYLEDVDSKSGPFCFVRGSHIKKMKNWESQDRWTENQMCEFYGKENVVEIEAKAGDVVIADNSGYHRGTKPQGHDRSALLLTYTLHREYLGGDVPSIPADVLHSQNPKRRAVLDLLKIA